MQTFLAGVTIASLAALGVAWLLWIEEQEDTNDDRN